MLRPPQPVLLPWLQPGGLEPRFQSPSRPPPFPLPCLAKAGIVIPAPITTAAISAAATTLLAITTTSHDYLACRKTSRVPGVFRFSRARGSADEAGAAIEDMSPGGAGAAFPAAVISLISGQCVERRSSASRPRWRSQARRPPTGRQRRC